MTTSRLRRIAGQALGVVRAPGVAVSARGHGRGALVFTYHDVTDDAANATDTVSSDRLKTQLQAARRLGLEFVDLAELTERVLCGHDVDHLGAVTFDDAFRGVHRAALPVLLELQIPATVFVVSDRLGVSDPEWYPGADRTMTEPELREVVEAGLSIGSHTRTHTPLVGLDRRDLHDELHESRVKLQALSGQRVDLLAYPGGYFDDDARAASGDAGYAAAFSFCNGRIRPGLDRFRLPRLSMGSDWGMPQLAYMLARPSWSFRDHQLTSVEP